MRFFKNNSRKAVKKPAPRPSEEIKQEYSKVLADSAQANYLVYVYKRQVDELNERLLSLNMEADERNKLDKANEPKAEEVANVQS